MKSTEEESYRRWKKIYCGGVSVHNFHLEYRSHVIINGLTNAELVEVVIRMDLNEALTKAQITKNN